MQKFWNLLSIKKTIIIKFSCFILFVFMILGASNNDDYMSIKVSRGYLMVNSYTIKFMEAHGQRTIATCSTDANGNVSGTCASCLSSICNGWDHVMGLTDPASRDMYGSEIATYPFTQYNYTTYYCVSGTSDPDNESKVCDACYVCNDDKNVMKWSADGSGADASCPSGYTKDSSINESMCVTKTPSCYVCDSDENVMSWGYSSEEIKANDNGKCTGNYAKDETIEESMCVTKTPSCYVCDSDKNVMSWGYSSEEIKTNDNGKCTGNYTKDETIEESLCKTFVPDIPEENIETGSFGVYMAWTVIIGVAVLGIGCWIYLIKNDVKSKES